MDGLDLDAGPVHGDELRRVGPLLRAQSVGRQEPQLEVHLEWKKTEEKKKYLQFIFMVYKTEKISYFTFKCCANFYSGQKFNFPPSLIYINHLRKHLDTVCNIRR